MSDLQKEFEQYKQHYEKELRGRFDSGRSFFVRASIRHSSYGDEWADTEYYRTDTYDDLLRACVAFLVRLKKAGSFAESDGPPEGEPTPWEEIDKIPRGPERKQAEWKRERYDSELGRHERQSFAHAACKEALLNKDGVAAYALCRRYADRMGLDFEFEYFQEV